MANQPQYLPFAGNWPDEMYLWERSDTNDAAASVAERGFDPIELNGEQPRQHILRRVNPLWESNALENSKFNTPKIWEHQFNTNETENLRPPRNRNVTVTKARHYWSPYDLLGLFLSKLGRAQPGATEDNFYLPLTAMYSQWCAQIGGRRARGVGDMSKYYQCTYRPDTGEFFLGASLAGYNPDWDNPLQVGQWKEGHPVPEDLLSPSIRKGLQWSRYEILKCNFPSFGWEFMQSPVLQTEVDGHKFGNCAETYPFMEMLGSPFTRADLLKM
ncbi:hypothetical protein FGADI_10095 [Fusarium gaditjirri]|uniref:Uncharacterized protein n=1 Tax=Fusarium gaditjirri TaxID=282569 RepID=A0A8H4SXY5_9HYPO|nr:hypothetical protein FGADI_10095 [Fusarium gaditjirri]